MKKIMTFLLAVLLVVTLIPASVSARNLTDEEKALFAYLREACTVLDDGTRDMNEALAQGENYVAALSAPLTEQQITMIKSEVAKAVEAVKAEQSGNVKDWSEETRNEVLERVDGAANTVGCTAVAGTNGTITVKDSNGKTVVSTNKVIKTTGFDAGASLTFASVALTLLCACAYVSKKAELF